MALEDPIRMTDRGVEQEKLLKKLKEQLPALRTLLEECSGQWGYEDPVYRYYHQSFKVFKLQEQTLKIVEALHCLAPQRPLNKRFKEIVEEGTGKTFRLDYNANWAPVARPIVEAFFHARYFLEMACRYGEELDEAPSMLPSGWAAFLYLFNLR